MSIAGYFGSSSVDLRVTTGDLSKGVAEVASGKLQVEVAEAEVTPGGERYTSVGDYDPVLRAHCRLDQEG
jgi:hypothetical protein